MTDEITLKATKGFAQSTYNWQYSTDNNTWHDFPSKVKYGDNKSEVTFKGTDLLNEDEFRPMIGKRNLYVRINALTEEKHNAIVLYPCLSAPHIVTTTYEQEKCNNSGDATISFTMDRSLYPGEVVYIKKNNQIEESQEPLILDATNTAKLTNIIAGNYTFTLLASLNNQVSYAGASSHTCKLMVENRPPVVHSVVSNRQVSCNQGSDGQITIQASGGNGLFSGHLFPDGQQESIRTISFSAGNTGVFSRLKAGKYRIEIYDTNGCTAYQSNGNVLSHAVEIQEPLLPVAVSLEHFTMPLAYDTSDGESIIRVNGGTQSSEGYTIIWRSESGQSYAAHSSSRDGNSFLYTFKGLHRGKYYITVEDKNYLSLLPADQVIPCGCSDTLSFYLPAPPLLEVKIEQTRHIYCYGSDEGQLTAHAKGGVPFPSSMPYTYTWYSLTEGRQQELSQSNDSVADNLTAGKYQIKITDANRITALSDPFTVTQPDSLEIRFETSSIGCSGNETGQIKAFVKGGTPPYKYQWNREGETSSEITALEAGFYMLKVTDSNNCRLIASTEVKAPGNLQVDTLITQPSCLSPNGGSIELKLSGATPPYKVLWADNQSTSLVRKGLSPGTYHAVVTDQNGCNSPYSFVMNKLREFSVKLGEGFTMCRDQSRILQATCDEPDITYKWYHNDKQLSDTGHSITVAKEGIYRVVATNAQGCSATDEIHVATSQQTLNLDFAIPTRVAVNADIHAVNLSTVIADQIRWNFPEESIVSKQTEIEAVFSLRQKGIYSLTMEGIKADCSTLVTRTFEVVGKDEVDLPDSKQPLIKQFLVTPNPTTGYFKVLIELNRKEDFTLLLYSPSGVLLDQKDVQQLQSKIFEYEVNGNMQGTCLLHLQTQSDKSVLQVVIKRN